MQRNLSNLRRIDCSRSHSHQECVGPITLAFASNELCKPATFLLRTYALWERNFLIIVILGPIVIVNAVFNTVSHIACVLVIDLNNILAESRCQSSRSLRSFRKWSIEWGVYRHFCPWVCDKLILHVKPLLNLLFYILVVSYHRTPHLRPQRNLISYLQYEHRRMP